MSRLESIVVGAAIAVACPLLLFVFCWWTTAALQMNRVLPISVDFAIAAAWTGLALGVALDLGSVRRWARGFYAANLKVLVFLYLCLSVIAVAFCMGVPLGNIVLGTIAGLYVGRRHVHARASAETFAKSVRQTSLFAAAVTALESLPIGLLGLGERHITGRIAAMTGLSESLLTGPVGMGAVLVLCGLLFVIQYGCTRLAATVAFRAE